MQWLLRDKYFIHRNIKQYIFKLFKLNIWNKYTLKNVFIYMGNNIRRTLAFQLSLIFLHNIL